MALYRWDTKLSGMGNWFQPENTWTTWQVLKKTATGYNWWDITPPVTSVNSKTGAVTLTTDDISVANDKNYVSSTEKSTWDWKQSALVSWTNIKTINSNSILWSWNLEISWLPSWWTTWQVITKTTNWAVWADNPGITISWASFGSFINACKANWTKHTISVSAWGITYTVKWMWFIFVNYNVWHALSINWETVFSDSFSSWGYTYMYYAWPITVTAWDVISIWKPSSSWYFSATIYDYYDWTIPTTSPGIYYNSSLWLISLSRNWSDWITMMDKNLWATSNDPTSSSSYWAYYQFGNDYPFYSGPSTSSAQADLSAYWPDNRYSSSSYYVTSNADGSMKDSSWNRNLWWEDTYKSTGDKSVLRWPCSTWYHIPSDNEIDTLDYIISWFWLNTKEWLQTYLKIPMSWTLSYDYWVLVNTWNIWCIVSTFRFSDYGRFKTYWRDNFQGNYEVHAWAAHWANAFPIRPFKDEPAQPTLEWDILYQPS